MYINLNLLIGVIAPLHVIINWERFHMYVRADSKLQWWIVILIFGLPSLDWFGLLSLQFSIPKRGEQGWLVSVFLWHADCYLIWDRISIRKCAVFLRWWFRRSRSTVSQDQNLEVKAFIQTAILLHNLRDASLEILENTFGPSFEVCNWN